MTEIEVTTVTGEALTPHLAAVARLRVEVFAEWPYLYEGQPGYEERYLRHYAQSPGAAVVLALAGGEAVGAATCQPAAMKARAVARPIPLPAPVIRMVWVMQPLPRHSRTS